MTVRPSTPSGVPLLDFEPLPRRAADSVLHNKERTRFVASAIPSKSFQQRVESLVQGLHVLASLGITAVVEAGSTMGEVTEVCQAAYEARSLPIRAVIYDGWFRSGDPQGLGDPTLIGARLDSLGFNQSGDTMLRIRGAKSSADGGVGSRSTAVSVAYLPIPDDPLGTENYGAFRDPDPDYRLAQFREIAQRGWEIHTHAYGDAAIRQTMDVYKVLIDEIRRHCFPVSLADLGTGPTEPMREP